MINFTAYDLHVTKRNASILAVLVMVALILFVYWPVQSYNFINYDDQGYVTSNDLVRTGFTRNNLLEAFSNHYLGNWHPLTMVSHMLDWQLYGSHAGGHHWTNVIIHILNTILLFLLLRTLTGAMWRSAFVATLFAIHPINVESVAWIAERKNVLSTFFWIGTLLLYVWYVKSPDWKRYLSVLICFVLGLMSKPMLVTLPFVLLLLDYWPLNRMEIKQSNDDQTTKTAEVALKRKRILFLVLEKVPLIVLSAIFSYLTLFIQKNAGAVLGLQSFPLSYRLGNAVISYELYIRKMFWPFDLAAFYPLNYHMSLWQVIFPALWLIVITVFVSIYFRKLPYLLMGWLWYLGTLVPVIGIVQVGDQALADRYAYVPLVGLFIMLTWGAFDIIKKHFSSRIILIISLLIITGLAIAAHRQVKYWQNTFTLFSHALDVTQNNAFAHSSVAGQLLMQNKVDEAMRHCEIALKLNPHSYNTLVRIARAYSMRGEKDKAIDALQQAIQVQPGYVKAYDDLYVILMQMGRGKEALQEYRKAADINGDNPDIHFNFGNALAMHGAYDEAIEQFKKVIQLRPLDAGAYSNIGVILMHLDNKDAAIRYLKEALKINPDYAYAHYQLSIILKKMGMVEESEYHFNEAIRIDPAYKNKKY
ncbi:MAG TPA: tetratricopeptide repeat protein [Smithella sp.]|nr:tetratricopeptide repeat protein [Smithella sp.]